MIIIIIIMILIIIIQIIIFADSRLNVSKFTVHEYLIKVKCNKHNNTEAGEKHALEKTVDKLRNRQLITLVTKQTIAISSE